MDTALRTDTALCRHELARYGVSYLDSTDTLYAGRIDSRSGEMIVHLTPCETLQLYYEPGYEQCFGLGISYITNLIAYYWNNQIPNYFPVLYLADLVDLIAADPSSIYVNESEPILRESAEMRVSMRFFLRDIGTVPENVIERIRRNLDFQTLQSH